MRCDREFQRSLQHRDHRFGVGGRQPEIDLVKLSCEALYVSASGWIRQDSLARFSRTNQTVRRRVSKLAGPFERHPAKRSGQRSSSGRPYSHPLMAAL